MILEEYSEAYSEGTLFNIELIELWGAVCRNEPTVDYFNKMRVRALHAAAEWVQVAAMCYKATVGRQSRE